MDFSSLFCCVQGMDRSNKGKKLQKCRMYSSKELRAATNDFNYDNKLGEGEYGSVYWGQLWNGSQIAVKKLNCHSEKAVMESTVEVAILALIRHKNLINLGGLCAEGRELLMIVHDYMPNSSLFSHLHGGKSAENLLDWDRRMKIAIGSAEGIAYLHHHATARIIHGDIKPSNVLLDSDFQARVANFHFAKVMPDGATHVFTRVKGSLGYLAPEYAMLGKASESCDVYSFGIFLLELVSGKKPVEAKLLITYEWALPLACEKKFDEIADLRLNGKFVAEELRRIVLVGLLCSHTRPEKRPTMLKVVELLKGDSKERFATLEHDEMFKI